MRNMRSKLLLLTVLFLSQQTIAGECGRIPSWLSLSEVTFRVTEPTEIYEVKIDLPSLSGLECSELNFEYGTDYEFTLESTPVRLSYSQEGKKTLSRDSEMRFLTAHSVMLAVEREKTPHYLEVRDEELEITYQVYLSKKGPAYVRRQGADRKLKIVSFKK